MARSIQDILSNISEAVTRVRELFNVISDEVSNDPNLADLDSPSRTAEYNLWKDVFASMAYIQEGQFEQNKAEIEAIIENGIHGNSRKMALEVKRFQYGDSLLFNIETGRYYYAIIDATKQIVKRVAVVTQAGLTYFKVANEDGSGNPIAFTSPQLNAFNAFLDRIKWAGTNVVGVSSASDKLKLPITVRYIPLNPTQTQADVQAAANNYLKNLEFNGRFYVIRLQDAIQSVTNVVDVIPGAIEGRADSGAFLPIDRYYDPVSGYLEVDAAFPLSTTITFEAVNE